MFLFFYKMINLLHGFHTRAKIVNTSVISNATKKNEINS